MDQMGLNVQLHVQNRISLIGLDNWLQQHNDNLARHILLTVKQELKFEAEILCNKLHFQYVLLLTFSYNHVKF